MLLLVAGFEYVNWEMLYERDWLSGLPVRKRLSVGSPGGMNWLGEMTGLAEVAGCDFWDSKHRFDSVVSWACLSGPEGSAELARR